jgi:hypothetical protein
MSRHASHGGWRRSLLLVGVCAVALVALSAGLAGANGPAIDFTTPGVLVNSWSPVNNGFSMGWEFNVLNPVQVSRLGYFNYGVSGGGITTSHQVGIFDSVGNLLVSTTVNPGDPTSGLWVWKSLASPFTLAAGNGYRIAGLTGPSDLHTYSVASIVQDPNIAYVTNRYIRTPTGTLINPTFTTTRYSGYHYFGPNFDIVPEPALMQLPFLLGMGGFAYWRRRKAA